jgi:hypothetical protein
MPWKQRNSAQKKRAAFILSVVIQAVIAILTGRP